ncbi:unnamed protein product [Penicillium viridicatum]
MTYRRHCIGICFGICEPSSQLHRSIKIVHCGFDGICGISAGFFWSVEGAVATGYPEQHKRGRHIATWFAFRNFGNIIGGAVSLAINHRVNQRGQVWYQTYLAFIAIQCLGLVIGPLLSNPEKVQRDDGTRIEAPRGIHWREEHREIWHISRDLSHRSRACTRKLHVCGCWNAGDLVGWFVGGSALVEKSQA